MEQKRTFAAIAAEIKATWKKPYFGAAPYIAALSTIHSSDKNAPYMFETAESVVRYFLANATYWRGADAKRIKAELKSMIA